MKFISACLVGIFIVLPGFGKTNSEDLKNADTLVIKDVSKQPKNSIADIDVVILKDDLSIGTHTPSNWILDLSAAKNLGVCAMYIVKGFNFDNSPAILYPRISGQKCEDEKVLEAVVQEQAKAYKNRSVNFKLEKIPSYKNKKGLIFEVRKYLNGPSPNNFEMVGYLRYKKELFLAVYSAKDLKSFNENINAFNDFLDRVTPYDTDMSALSGSCLYPKK